jgi:8-oxo-dGTP pyrophosphatase MutT (NUDIX family)
MLTQTKGEKVFAGTIFDVYRETYTDEHGVACVRDIVRKPPAVAVLAYDKEGFWVVYQPREAVGNPTFMELPAGRLDVEGEAPLDCAARELLEEVGVRADEWVEIASFYSSPGFTDEKVTVYAATSLEEATRPAADDETYPIKLPYDMLGPTRAECDDAKTLIALGWLSDRREEERAREVRDARGAG